MTIAKTKSQHTQKWDLMNVNIEYSQHNGKYMTSTQTEPKLK